MTHIRIPNLPTGRIVDENGNTSDEEQTFRQTLITSLQDNFGNEGCVVPSQTSANITKIQDHTIIDQATGLTVYTCQFGTLIFNNEPYDAITNPQGNSLLVAVDDGTGKPIFKIVNVT